MGTLVTRFAPRPTGRLHLGHAFAALLPWELARSTGGRFLLRIEDIDAGRCSPESEAGIYEDLEWLGIGWEEPVRRQSEYLEDYVRAVGQLEDLRVVYPCFCTRKDIQAEVVAMGGAPHGGEVVYPGTCRGLSEDERRGRIEAGEAYALRLDVGHAWRLAGEDLVWRDRVAGEVRAAPGELGDVVLARKDIGTSYHVAVVVDDALQGVNLVTRGDDLFGSSRSLCCKFLSTLPAVRRLVRTDVEAAYDGDPAAKSFEEIILSYPCIEAIAVQRMAHILYALDVPLLPRMMTEWVHDRTGIDIHPGAHIGERFFIDHGTGVVVGETCEIGKNVKLYQGVTLGARSFPKDDKGRIIKGTKRHPTVEDDVTVYANATILGGETTIGARSTIGASVFLMHSVPPDTAVALAETNYTIKTKTKH